MADALAPRGPDDEGIETWENVGLVNRRLAIVDPGPAGAQPMADPDHRLLLTFKGQVYDHLLLREELEVPAGRWREFATEAGPRVGFLLWTAEIWARLLIDGSSVARVEAELWRGRPGWARGI
jgi:asparagine synthase (glutamine-hydrolysing)